MRRFFLIIIFAVLFFANLAHAGVSPTLFERLGGTEPIKSAVSKMIDKISTDSRSRRSFANVNIEALKASVSQHICFISGGPCKYEGATMEKAHKDLNLTHAEFILLDQFLVESFNDFGIDPLAVDELRSLLAKMEPDVIGK